MPGVSRDLNYLRSVSQVDAQRYDAEKQWDEHRGYHGELNDRRSSLVLLPHGLSSNRLFHVISACPTAWEWSRWPLAPSGLPTRPKSRAPSHPVQTDTSMPRKGRLP